MEPFDIKEQQQKTQMQEKRQIAVNQMSQWAETESFKAWTRIPPGLASLA